MVKARARSTKRSRVTARLVNRVPHVRLALARLLICAATSQLPRTERDWDEVESLLDDAAKSSPESVEPLLLRAEMAMAQDKSAAARDELEKGRRGFPRASPSGAAQANLLLIEKQFDEASRLLDQARKELGDSVELRLERARLAVAERGTPGRCQLERTERKPRVVFEGGSTQASDRTGQGASRGCRIPEGPAGYGLDWPNKSPMISNIRLKLLDLAFQSGEQEPDRVDHQANRADRRKRGVVGRSVPGAISGLAGRAGP